MNYMTFEEELPKDSKQVPTKLSVFANNNDKISIEMSTGTGDPWDFQSMELGSCDVQTLISELQRLLNEYTMKP